jgi:tetratricopeptide (TPR) repeat protein
MRFFLLTLLVLTVPMPALAMPQCDGALVDSSLPDTKRIEQLNNRAFACLKASKPKRSIALFSELIGVDPDNAHAHLNRGSTFVKMHEFDAGLNDYTRAIELEPSHFEGWYNGGSARVAARQYDEAIADLTKAIRLKPDLAYAYCNRGLSYLLRAEPKDALADFEKGLTLRINMPLCYSGRGEILLSRGQYRKAIEDLTRGINFKPTANAMMLRATAYDKLGENNKALGDYRSALSLQPNLKDARAGVARLSQKGNTTSELGK